MNKSVLETASFFFTISKGKAIALKGFYIDSTSYGDIGTFSHGGEMSICITV